MFARIALLAAALAAMPSARAADESIAGLARETGLSERNVRMVVGARTAFPEYRIVFNRVDRQFKRAVGEDRYQQLTGRKALPDADAADAETRLANRRADGHGKVATR